LINLNSDNFPNGVQVSGSGGWSIDDGGLNGFGVIAIQTTGEFHVSGVGIATLGSGSTLSASVVSGDGTISCSNYALNILDGDASKPFSGTLGTGARLVKTGAGTQVIASEQAYTGGTSIQGGNLEVNNPNARGSGVGSGELDVENGGTLTGTGGAGSFSFVKSGGTLAPGSSGAGTLSFFGLTLEGGSKLSLDLGDGVPSDLVRVYDSAFAAEGVNVEINDVGLKKGVTTWFANWTGALILQPGGIVPADFALVNTPGIAGLFVVDNANNRVGFTPLALPLYGDYNGNGIVDAADYTLWRKTLGQSVAKGSGSAVPEPATIVLLWLGLIVAGLQRRRDIPCRRA
jgi:autotransporter-associated beta strand protein